MRKQTKEHIEKKALARRRGSNFDCIECGKQFWRSPSSIKKGDNKFCSRICYFKNQIGKSKSMANRPKLIGKDNPNWRGGVTTDNHKIRNSDEYKKWRKSVFERDNWTCKNCGKRSKSNEYLLIQAHHIKPFATYPQLRFEISNGVTLCKQCHDKEPKGKDVYHVK